MSLVFGAERKSDVFPAKTFSCCQCDKKIKSKRFSKYLEFTIESTAGLVDYAKVTFSNFVKLGARWVGG